MADLSNPNTQARYRATTKNSPNFGASSIKLQKCEGCKRRKSVAQFKEGKTCSQCRSLLKGK